jgi:hypothetical protein
MEGSVSDLAGMFTTMWALGAVFLVVGLLAGLACVYRRGFVSLTASALRLVRVERTAFGSKLLLLIERFALALEEAGSRGGLLRATALSIALWGGVIAFYSVLLVAFDWPEEQTVVVPAVLASGLASLANTLPINGFAGFGTQESGWVLGMSLWGVDRELALAVGLSAHLVQLGNLILFGLLGHLGMAILPKTKARGA